MVKLSVHAGVQPECAARGYLRCRSMLETCPHHTFPPRGRAACPTWDSAVRDQGGLSTSKAVKPGGIRKFPLVKPNLHTRHRTIRTASHHASNE